MFEENIVGKTNDGTNNNYQEEYPDKFVAFHDGHSGPECSANGIAYRHWYGNGKQYSSTGKEEYDGAKVGCHVYQLGIGTGF